MIKQLTVAALTLGTLLSTSAASAQVGVALRGGTLGLGGEVSLRATPLVGVRLGANTLSFNRDLTVDQIDYQINPELKSASAIIDLHPGRGGFRISAGLLWHDNNADIEARLNGPVTIGSRTYAPEDIGSLTGGLEYTKGQAPYFGLGFGGGGRLSFLFDVGVVATGHPRASLSGTTNLTGPERDVFEQNVEQEVADFQAEIDRRSYLKFYPVVSLGLRIGF